MFRRAFSRPAAGVFLSCLLLLSACAAAVPAGDLPSTPTNVGQEPSAPATAGIDSLAGRGWILTSMAGRENAAGAAVTLQFTQDGTLLGSAGCNRYNGAFTSKGGTISVEPLGTTLMACEQPVMEQETAYLAALQGAVAFVLEGDRLTLTDEVGTEVLVFAAESDELPGSAWTVSAYNDGNEGVTSPLQDTDANVTFAKDGALSGTGGCNRIIGKYTAEQGVLKIESLGTTRMACPEPAGVMEQEAGLMKALESATGYAIDGDDLLLTTTDGATAMTLTRG